MRNHSVCKGEMAPNLSPGWDVGSNWLSWAGKEPLPELCLVLNMCDCTERRMGPGKGRLVLCPLGCSSQRSLMIVAQQKWLSLLLVINIWFYFSGFSCLSSILAFLYFVLLVWHLCLSEVLLFIPLGSSGREGLCWPGLGAEWPGCVQVSPPLSAPACLSLLLCAASLIYPLLFSKDGHALVEAAAGEELWLSCAQTRTWIKKKLVILAEFCLESEELKWHLPCVVLQSLALLLWWGSLQFSVFHVALWVHPLQKCWHRARASLMPALGGETCSYQRSCQGFLFNFFDLG